MAPAADGKCLAAGGRYGKTLSLRDAVSGRELRQIGLPDPIYALAGAPASGLLAVQCREDLHWLDAETGRMLARTPSAQLDALAFSPDGKLLAGWNDQRVVLLETATRQKIWELPTKAGGKCGALAITPAGQVLALREATGKRHQQGHLASGPELWDLDRRQLLRWFPSTPEEDVYPSPSVLSPDGRWLAGNESGAVVLWDVAALIKQAAPAAPDRAQQERLWGDLAGEDAARAYQAGRTLRAVPAAAVALCRTRLRPAVARELKPWIADLDANDFALRQKATDELARVGSDAEPALRAALASRPSPEARRRIEGLLHRLATLRLPAEELRQVRAVQVLEQIGTPEARQQLQHLATGAPAARLTREAKAALSRLTRALPPG